MHLGKTLALFSLSSGALSFKIRAISGKDCSGDAQEVNVWDNTCRDMEVSKTNSFRVLSYGAHRQRADFYEYGVCHGQVWTDFWADGGSDTFKKNACITLDFQSSAYGSRSS
ncbi:hypothetical protein N7471_010932 [Penicillium samsonianum]|uniref:uncharacterized protein n=1 Tax=Penicillium samsonianum TaxID=1882272 RepID=UPI0025467DB5|nr:uncharacterized protein N7471_010932 [Penicillium samsonianum]KAJ6123615.1 hypothetical protein N7471_010932 [Penicillium samsonianum]